MARVTFQKPRARALELFLAYAPRSCGTPSNFANKGGSDYYPALRVRPPADAVLMLFMMAIITEQLQVRPVQRNFRPMYVLRRQAYFVVDLRTRNNLPGSITPLTHPAHALRVSSPAFDPCRRYVKRMSETVLFFLLLHVTILS